jgi:calcineurin-like phosphoesterase family protein
MDWFTSDTHFCHDNIIKYCNRPFSDVDQMNEALIDNWNGCVQPGDNIYHLGDFGTYKDLSSIEKIIKRLNGNKFLVAGNHDYSKFINQCGKYFKKISDIDSIKIKDTTATNGVQIVFLSHYGMRVWDKSHFGSWCLFGHSHNRLPPHGLSVDVGVDSTYITGKAEYRPFSYKEIRTFMSTQNIFFEVGKNGGY